MMHFQLLRRVAAVTGLLIAIASLMPDLASGASCSGKTVNGYCVAAHARLGGANLAGSDLSNLNLQGIDLSNADLSGADLSGAVLSKARLDGANLSSAIISGARFEKATAVGLRSGALVGSPSSLPKNWQLVNGYLAGPRAELMGARLGSGSSWWGWLGGWSLGCQPNWYPSNVNLSGADLRNADLSGSCFWSWNFTGANLEGADLSGSLLFASNFRRSNLSNADLSNTWPYFSDMSGANISGANLNFGVPENPIGNRNLGLNAVDLVGSPSSLPSSFHLIKNCLFGPGVFIYPPDYSIVNEIDFKPQTSAASKIDLTNVNLSGMDWSYGAGFVDFSGSNMSNMNLSQTGMARSTLRSVDLTNTNLEGAVLAGVDMRSAHLSGNNVSNTIFYMNAFEGMTSDGLFGTPRQLPRGWRITAGSLVGPTK